MLTGYRVLDITQFVAGPTCTRLLAELGADVIKLEPAPDGDRGRAFGDKPRDPKFKISSQSTYFFQHNHSKKSLAVDIKRARGRELIRSIVPKVDVLIENDELLHEVGGRLVVFVGCRNELRQPVCVPGHPAQLACGE